MPKPTGIFDHTGHARPGDGRAWPVFIVLLAAALVPAGCVLWFMNAAMRNEELAIRQRLLDAYRQNLTVVRDALQTQWTRRQHLIEGASQLPTAPEVFGNLIDAQVADGVVIFDRDGNVAYPAGAVESPPQPEIEGWDQAAELEDTAHYEPAADAYARIAKAYQDRNVRALAMQAQARALVKVAKIPEALALLRTLCSAEFADARDNSGRLLGPSACLFALKLMPRTSPEWELVAKNLAARLGDYSGPPMSSSQRTLLLSELQELSGTALPVLLGEHWTAACIAQIRPPADQPAGLHRAGERILEMRSSDRRVVALYRLETVKSMVGSADRNTRIELHDAADWGRAGEPAMGLPMTGLLSGWRLAIYESAGRAPAHGRAALYLWTGAAGVILTAGVALAAGRYVSRQMAVTRLKNDLIATVSHELKTPVASTRMLVETLLEDSEKLSGRVKDYLELIARENQRLSRLIENFLTFSRMERNKRAFEMAPIDLREVVQTGAEAVAERFNTPGCQLDIILTDHQVPARGDRDALVTAVVNLLDNAHKYTGERKSVAVKLATEKTDALIEVRDNGIGLSRADTRHIFDRFYQVDQTLSRRTGGCGLGLSIVKFITEAHGGTVNVDSRPGDGSRFTLRLPLSAAIPQETQHVAAR